MSAVRRVCIDGPSGQMHDRIARPDRFPMPKEDASHVAAVWALMNTTHDPAVDLDRCKRSLLENLRSGRRLPWGFEAAYEFDFIAPLRAIARPTPVIAPEEDLRTQTHAAAPLIQNARLAPWRGCAHGFRQVKAAEATLHFDDFLDNEAPA